MIPSRWFDPRCDSDKQEDQNARHFICFAPSGKFWPENAAHQYIVSTGEKLSTDEKFSTDEKKFSKKFSSDQYFSTYKSAYSTAQRQFSKGGFASR